MLEVNKRPKRNILSVERIENVLILKTNHGMIKIEPKTSEIIRVVYTLRDSFSDESKPGVIYDGDYSDWNYTEDEENIEIKTDDLVVRVSKETSSIYYYDHSGKVLFSERDYESKNLEEFDSYKVSDEEDIKVERIQTADGVKEVIKEASMEFDKKLYRTRLYTNWDKDEAIYGLGQHEEGHLNLRGKTQYVHQANMKIAIPFIISSKGYGLLMDTYSPMIFNDTSDQPYLYTEADLEMDYYFMYGENIDGVVKCYRTLTGKASMLPKWAFGYIQSQERYETAQEIEAVADEYRDRKIGLDCIVLDWQSWEDNLWGQKTFDKERFPDPSKMMENLHEKDVKLMISIWPNMDEKSDNYKEFKDNKLLFPASNIYDALDKKGRELYWQQAYSGLFKHGIDAWWCDSSEPFTPEWNYIQKPEPSNTYHEFFETGSKYMPAEYSNSYGLMHAMTMYNGQRETTDEKRVTNLTRSGYTGQQRYGAILWSGDISADWDTFKKQIAAGLNLSICGIPYWTLDIGAFFVKKGVQWYWNGDYDDGNEDLGYRELFTRWFQFASFLPIFRGHGTDVRRELWYFGEEGTMFYDTLIKFNKLRYKLMPYIYSMAGRVWKDDYTMLRMLAFDFPEDKKAREINDQYMFGDSIMVCPVTKPMYYDVGSQEINNVDKTRQVYLPENSGWYDFWTGDYYEGGQVITADCPIDKMPLYVKEGSIIPMTEPIEFANQKPNGPLQIHIYTGKDADFELYEDEGDGYNYEKGQYAVTKMSWNEKNEKLDISETQGNYKEMIEDKEYKTYIYKKDGIK